MRDPGIWKNEIYEMLKQTDEYIDKAKMYGLFIVRNLIIIKNHAMVQGAAAGGQKKSEPSFLSRFMNYFEKSNIQLNMDFCGRYLRIAVKIFRVWMCRFCF